MSEEPPRKKQKLDRYANDVKSDDVKSDVENNGSLQATVEQCLLSVMYGAYSGGDAAIQAPDNQTIIPLLSFAGGGISQSVMTGLTNPNTAKEYVDALAEFSIMVDIHFTLTPAQNDLGATGGARDSKRLSQVWGNILKASVGLSKDDPEETKKYKALQAQLWEAGKENPITGIMSARKKSSLYSTEEEKHLAYLNVLSSYITLESDIAKSDPQKWSRLASIEQDKVKMASENWISSGKNEVEQILANMDNLLRGSTNELITAARDLFKCAKNTSQKLGDFYQVVLTPTDAFSKDSKSWVNLATKKGADYSRIKKTSLQAGASYGASWGKWCVSAEGKYSKDTYTEDTETSNASINIKYARVNLSRPWMDNSYMQAPDWYYGGFNKGKISLGSVAKNIGQNELILSAYPIALIIAKDIRIEAKFSANHIKQIEKAMNGGAKVALGPFKIDASFSKTSFEKTTASTETNGIIQIEGPIIIAYIVETPPRSAPKKKP